MAFCLIGKFENFKNNCILKIRKIFFIDSWKAKKQFKHMKKMKVKRILKLIRMRIV